jgi:hypothetical protein
MVPKSCCAVLCTDAVPALRSLWFEIGPIASAPEAKVAGVGGLTPLTSPSRNVTIPRMLIHPPEFGLAIKGPNLRGIKRNPSTPEGGLQWSPVGHHPRELPEPSRDYGVGPVSVFLASTVTLRGLAALTPQPKPPGSGSNGESGACDVGK